MKKVLLLIVAAVFMIGIQSCSTEEEEVLIEENQVKQKSNIPKNAVHFGVSNTSKEMEYGERIKSFFVRYPVGTSYEYRLNFTNNVGNQLFDDFYVVFDNGCAYVDEWFVTVTCYTSDCEDQERTGSGNSVDHDQVNNSTVEDGEFTNGDDVIYKTCSDVPLRYPDTHPINININDNNNTEPCLNCAGTPDE